MISAVCMSNRMTTATVSHLEADAGSAADTDTDADNALARACAAARLYAEASHAATTRAEAAPGCLHVAAELARKLLQGNEIVIIVSTAHRNTPVSCKIGPPASSKRSPA